MQVKTASDLGALIRDRRLQLGWTQEALAGRVGVGRLWVVQLEKGKRTAQLGLALRTLKELGLVLQTTVAPPLAPGTIDLDEIIRGPRSTTP